MIRARVSLVVAATVATWATPSYSEAQAAYSLEDIAFLTGCWKGQMGTLDMREQWSEAEAGVMLGNTRFIRAGRMADFEFGMFVESEEGVTLWPYPRGERSANGFPLARIQEGREFVFENLEHDFPVRIIYVHDRPDHLAPRIEGRDGESRGWSLSRVSCPG